MSAFAGMAQALAAGFWLITAVYALLASQTFAYEQFLKPALLPALTWFADAHRVFTPSVLAVYVAFHALSGTFRRRRGAVALTVVGAIWTVASVAFAMLPPLSALVPGTTADAAVFLALGPLLFVAAVDLAVAPPVGAGRPHERHAADFVACLLAGVLSGGMAAAIAVAAGAPLDGASAPALATSGLLHLIVFVAVFLCLTVARAMAVLAGSRRLEFVAASMLLAGGIFVFLWRTVFPTVVADLPHQLALSAAFAVAVSVVIAARGLSVSSEADDSLVRLTAALAPRVAAHTPGFLAWLLVVTAAAWMGGRASRTADWDFVLADLTVVATWLLTLAAALRVVRLQAAGRPALVFAATLVVLVINAAWTRTALAVSSANAPSSRAWLAHDSAARLLAGAVSHDTASADDSLVDFLQAHTNVPVSVKVEPVEITLAPVLPRASDRPHIFLFVIDSLRRDYLGAYNPAVRFTPALDAFARDGVAFSQAFSRYGATGLAVPSIWTGGMLLHKQYVRPFPPMNPLAKLLHAQEYAQWISMDHILDTILPASDRRVPLDADRTVKDFRLCRTLDEVRGRLASRPTDADPVFVYTLPQDIHVSAVAREGGTSKSDGAYEGFHAPVASRVEAFDACFGAFVEDLKARGLYDESIIIVTSDHGDSLGEDGRMGHAYTLYPEVVRIPLIVRLPSRVSAELEAENHGLVFSTDITPTLFALLGKTPSHPRPFFGRPLFRAHGTPPRGPDGAVPVMAASYGAVYGALLDEGATLYVLDTINLQEHAFALNGGGPPTTLAVSDDRRRAGQRAIRETVQGLGEYFGYKAGLY